jgi:hypothetical protein
VYFLELASVPEILHHAHLRGLMNVLPLPQDMVEGARQQTLHHLDYVVSKEHNAFVLGRRLRSCNVLTTYECVVCRLCN